MFVRPQGTPSPNVRPILHAAPPPLAPRAPLVAADAGPDVALGGQQVDLPLAANLNHNLPFFLADALLAPPARPNPPSSRVSSASSATRFSTNETLQSGEVSSPTPRT